MKKTYTIVTIKENDTVVETCNHFVTLKRMLTERGVRIHRDDHLAGRLIHQDLIGNEVIVFASAPMGLELRYVLKPAVYMEREDPEQLAIPGTGVRNHE